MKRVFKQSKFAGLGFIMPLLLNDAFGNKSPEVMIIMAWIGYIVAILGSFIGDF